MRIVIIAGDASPMVDPSLARGGPHQRLGCLARALAGRGHSVEVFARRCRPGLPDRADAGPGVSVTHLGAGPLGPLDDADAPALVPQQAEAVRRDWAERGNPDVVHAHGWQAGLVALAAARARPGPDVPLLVHSRLGDESAAEAGPGARGEVGVRLRRLRTLLARTADGAIASDTDEADRLLRLGVPRERIRLVPQGVDVERFRPAAMPVEPQPEERPAFLLTLDGHAADLRGDPEVATTVAALAAVPEARLQVAGGPGPCPRPVSPPPHGPGASASARAGADGRVAYLGEVPHAEVPALLAASDVLVSAPAARRHPVGAAVLEAMACGVPVVASDVGALRELVVDRVTGLLVPPERPDLLADALRRLLRHSARRAALGVAGADKARSRHSWDRIAGETEQFYRDLARLGAARRPAAAPH